MRFFFLIILSFSLLSGCTKAQKEQGKSNNSDSEIADANEFGSLCGVVIDGTVYQPVNASDGRSVRVLQVLSPTTLAISEIGDANSGAILLSLHGVKESATMDRAIAINALESLITDTMYMYVPSESCQASLADGGSGIVGQLFTSSGKNITESLLQNGMVDLNISDVCGGSLLASCYAALKESAQPDPSETAGELNSFLWKPVSDSNGHLAVHTGPYGTTVIVNGETGQNQGPGNGYGSLARFSKAGCAYSGARVQVIDMSGLPYTVGGQTSFAVPNPCGRHCLTGGVIAACSK